MTRSESLGAGSEIMQATQTIPAEERGLAVAAHLSGLAGYIIPLGGVIVPIIIWPRMRKASRKPGRDGKNFHPSKSANIAKD